MAMNQLDKIKLMGVIKKKKIDCYNDLYIDSRSNLNIYDFLEATLDIAIKFITSDFSEKQVENSLNAIVFVLIQVNGNSLSIEDNNTYKKLTSLKEFKGKYNDMIDVVIDDIIDLTTQTCVVYDEDYESKKEAEEPQEETEINFEEEYGLSLNQIKILEEKISSFESQIKSLEKYIAKKEKNNDKLSKRATEQNGEIKRLRAEIERLKKLLNSETAQNNRKSKELDSYIRKFDDTSRENQYLNKKIEDLEEKSNIYQIKTELYDQSVSSREIYEKNYRQILELLAEQRVSIKEIEKTLYHNGVRLTYREIFNIINQIKIKYHVDERMNNFEKTYHIAAPAKTSGLNLDYKTGKRNLDIIVISDAHMGMLSNFDINTIDKIYEYMLQNGIKHILDLGDFFSFFSQAGAKVDKIYYCEKVIDRVIEHYPIAKDICHLILGGNHDEVLFRYGLDPLARLEENRSDFISMGYEYASIKFNRDIIGLYHPDFRVDRMMNDKGNRKLINYSMNVWKDSKIDFESIYANLYGHFHRLDIADNGIVMVPSLSYDRERKGAIHMRIHFDSLRNIDNITFIKLVIAGKVYDQEKHEYTRSYKK